MINLTTTVACFLLVAGTAMAQQKQSPRTTKAKSTTAGTISAVDAVRSSPSAADTHDGTMGVSTGTGTTLEQNQASKAGGTQATKTDAHSTVRTGTTSVKARKKSVKSGDS